MTHRAARRVRLGRFLVRAALFAAVVLLVVAAVGVVPTQLPTTPAEQVATTTTQEAAPTTTAVATTTVPGPARALISPSGVPVAIRGETGAGWMVLTPCGEEATLSAGTPVSNVDVVLDPGHGGPADPGAVAATGLTEQEINLVVARRVASDLGERGFSVLLTRTDDYPSTLAVRAGLADAVQARALVSVHHNAPTPGPSPVPGTEIFVQSGSGESQRLGGLIYERVTAALSAFDIAWASAPDAGVMAVLSSRGVDAYGMLRNPTTTSVLVEVAYISNRPEAELFATVQYLEAVSQAFAQAIEEFLTTDLPGGGFVEARTFNPAPGIGAALCEDPDLE